GVSGAQFQAVGNRAEAEAALSGEGISLSPGLYAFVDGNHLGGVGVVLVNQVGDGAAEVEEISVCVGEVFGGGHIACLPSAEAVASALSRLRNVLAELGGLYLALTRVAAGGIVTVVHDYEGVGAWLTGTWKAREATVREIVAACQGLISTKGLTVTFRHQSGHRSTVAGRNDFAFYNGLADALATSAHTSIALGGGAWTGGPSW
ncbi:MAG: hypothetical protein AAB253_05895, partial [candidate division NC10 bacterium]